MLVGQTENDLKYLTEKVSCGIRGAKKISELIRESRKRNGYSQEEFAAKCGLSSMQISRLETGKNVPSVKTLVKLGPYIGRSLEELLIASLYSGTVPTTERSYIDLEGKKCNLKSIAEEMYQTDAELFFKLYEYYKNSSAEDNQFLKAVLDTINTEKRVMKTAKTMPENEKQMWDLFHHIKSIFLIISQKIKKNVAGS